VICVFSFKISTMAWTEKQKQLLRKNYRELVQNTQVDGEFLDHFVPNRILTDNLIEKILVSDTFLPDLRPLYKAEPACAPLGLPR